MGSDRQVSLWDFRRGKLFTSVARLRWSRFVRYGIVERRLACGLFCQLLDSSVLRKEYQQLAVVKGKHLPCSCSARFSGSPRVIVD